MKVIKSLLLSCFLLTGSILSAQQTETRKISAFNKIDAGTPFDVFTEEGNEESVKLVLENIVLDNVITEVKDKILKVYLKKGNYKNIKGKVYITYKNLEAINNSGSGNLICNSDIKSGDFSIGLSGSGNASTKKIKAKQFKVRKSGSGKVEVSDIETEIAEISISGSGDLYIKNGYAKKEKINISGSGNVNASGVQTDECAVSISGSGNVDVNVAKQLYGIISGSGNIVYEGDAQVNSSNIAGSGRIRKR
ncbi:MAG: head GIN domain-containing protein [Agriterribacter sp.]